MIDAFEQTERLFHRVAIVGHPDRRSNSVPTIDIAYFSHRMNRDSVGREAVQNARRRLDRIVAAVRSPRERAGRSGKRPRDNAVHRVRGDEHGAGPLAPVVELRQGDDLFVGRHLKNRVRGRVQDRTPGLHVLAAELFDNLGSRSGLVSQRRFSGDLGKCVNDLFWKAVRIGRKRRLRDDAGHLPMSGDRVFAFAALAQARHARPRIPHRRDTPDIRQAAEPKFGKIG